MGAIPAVELANHRGLSCNAQTSWASAAATTVPRSRQQSPRRAESRTAASSTTPDGLVLCSCFSQAQLDAWGRTCDEHHEFAMISCEPGDACELVDICPSE